MDVSVVLIHRQVMLRARNLRAGANFIPSKAFRARKIYFCNEVCLLNTAYSSCPESLNACLLFGIKLK